MKKYLAILAPYSLLVSALYLFGFWGVFDINILEYIALADLVKAALYPLIYSSIFLVVGLFLGGFFAGSLSKSILRPGGGVSFPEAAYVYWGLRLIEVFCVALSLYLVFFEVGGTRWVQVAAILTIPVCMWIGDARFAEEYINNRSLRVFVVLILTEVMLYSYGFGAFDAEQLKKSDREFKINGNVSKHKYVGWAGGFLFLWDSSKGTVLVKSASTINTIELSVSNRRAIVDRFKEMRTE